jgi:hypothetical protein
VPIIGKLRGRFKAEHRAARRLPASAEESLFWLDCLEADGDVGSPLRRALGGMCEHIAIFVTLLKASALQPFPLQPFLTCLPPCRRIKSSKTPAHQGDELVAARR